MYLKRKDNKEITVFVKSKYFFFGRFAIMVAGPSIDPVMENLTSKPLTLSFALI